MRPLQNPMPRRLFLLQGGCLFGIGAALWTGFGARGTSRGCLAAFHQPEVKLTLDMLTKAIFDDCLGDTFRLHLDAERSTSAELLECAACGSGCGKNGKTGREPFSLVFRIPKEVLPPQRIYRLEHERLGDLDIFLVPIGPDDQGMRLEAVFT